jgi:hypothetical protein
MHVIATGGGLCADGTWKGVPNAGYLFPVQALSALFQGKFCAGLKGLRAQLDYYGEMLMYQNANRFAQLLDQATRRRRTAQDIVDPPRCPFCGCDRLRVILVVRPFHRRQPGGDSS